MGYSTITDTETGDGKDWTAELSTRYRDNQAAVFSGELGVPNAERIHQKAVNNSIAGYCIVNHQSGDIASSLTTSFQKFQECYITRQGVINLRSWVVESNESAGNGGGARTITWQWYKNGTGVGSTGGSLVAAIDDTDVKSTVAADSFSVAAGDLVQLYAKVDTTGSLITVDLNGQILIGNPLKYSLYEPP